MDGEIILPEDSPVRVCPDGATRPRVTHILADLGFTDFSGVSQAVLDEACNRGKRVHAAILSLEADLRFYDEVDSDILPYCDAYLEMKEATGWTPQLKEQFVFDEHWNYCGTLDGLGYMAKRSLEAVLPDWKSGVPQPAARWQTAAYVCAKSLGISPLIPRVAVYLKSNGKYSLEWFDKPEHKKDFLRWRSIVETFHLKHGGK